MFNSVTAWVDVQWGEWGASPEAARGTRCPLPPMARPLWQTGPPGGQSGSGPPLWRTRRSGQGIGILSTWPVKTRQPPCGVHSCGCCELRPASPRKLSPGCRQAPERANSQAHVASAEAARQRARSQPPPSARGGIRESGLSCTRTRGYRIPSSLATSLSRRIVHATAGAEALFHPAGGIWMQGAAQE
jgi:hypothetical protein